MTESLSTGAALRKSATMGSSSSSSRKLSANLEAKLHLAEATMTQGPTKEAFKPLSISITANASLVHPAVMALASPRVPSGSGSSFTALIKAVPPPSGNMTYPHSTDLPAADEAGGRGHANPASRSGLRTRMQHYFNRQKGL